MDVDGEDNVDAQQAAEDDVVDATAAIAAVGGSDLHLDQHVLPVPYSQASNVNKPGML